MKIFSINNLAKKSLIPILLAGSAYAYASSPIKNNAPEKVQNQTELVSPAGAEAIKASNLYSVQQTTAPTVHNTRLENIFRKFAGNAEEKKQVNSFINTLYTEKGAFLASAKIQHELDRQILFLLLEEKGDLLIKNGLNLELGKEISEYGSDFYKSVRPNAKRVCEWLDNNYSPKMTGLLSFDHKPTAEEVISRLDDIARNKANFTSDDFLKYKIASDGFNRNTINNKTDDISLSELIAFKIFLIDRMIFKKTLTNNDFFGKDSDFNEYIGLSSFYDKWIGTVEPKKK